MLALCIGARAQPPPLLFHSGFEPNTTLAQQQSNGSDIWGIDTRYGTHNDWTNDLEGAPYNCGFTIQYQGGNDTMRLAEIVPDPMDSTNHVLHFWIKHPNVEGKKGRVQGNVYNCETGFKSLWFRVKLLLPEDLDTLRHLPVTFKFFTLMEFWNNPGWSDPDNGFRMTLNLQKVDSFSDKLHFGIHGQTYNKQSDKYEDVWDEVNTDVDIPTQQWLSLDVRITEGVKSDDGMVYITMTPEGQDTKLIHFLQVDTHHPSASKVDGITHFNPFKLYTDAAMVNAMRFLGKRLHVYWDDFELSGDTSKHVVNVVEQHKEQSIQVFPNPASGWIRVQQNDVECQEYDLEIYDNMGRSVLHRHGIDECNSYINLTGLKQGVYELRIVNHHHQIHQQMIQIIN